ncbi:MULTISPECIES: hypothetical protein [Enterobacter]|uniref:hypothetical protein n=1 Tax=Enterobacter TaxID=547 RepID=UPI0005F94692|nr:MULTISPECIES: hypothetical protein [Enterobacter]KML21016.1 hypothetical protein VL10_20645 [Leclercia adecarboxylata]KMN63036.1 hypothetical protein VK95_20100 [Leclercia sp. LK8]KJX01843.1 hypothetical protein RZ87_01980 [Enterobacter roggenkampii]KZR38301.1 hypothetical protein A3467_04715 [Enterobacter roggenkampii]MBA2155141.1 hypothetical protein [Enterobacter roggenkampii]
MIYLLLGIALFAFFIGTVVFVRFSKVTGRSVQSPLTTMFFFDALFFGLGSKRDMNIAASSFIVFLVSIWGLTYLKLSTHFWGSRESYIGFAIAGILFLIMHCRYCAKNVVIKNDGLAPMRELINIRRSGLTSPFIWLSRAGYLGFFIGMLH